MTLIYNLNQLTKYVWRGDGIVSPHDEALFDLLDFAEDQMRDDTGQIISYQRRFHEPTRRFIADVVATIEDRPLVNRDLTTWGDLDRAGDVAAGGDVEAFEVGQ